MQCTAQKVTWTHQRKKKRLLKRLEACAPDNTQGCLGSESGALCKKSGIVFSLDMEEGKQEPSPIELQRTIEAEMASLCTPCNMEFAARIKFQDVPAASSTAKRKKRTESPARSEEGKEVCLELHWVHGDRDLLHQLLQYLQNKMHSRIFQ